jgi:hypothetical protein
MHFDVVGAADLDGDVMGEYGLDGDVMGDGEIVGAIVRKRGGGHRLLKLKGSGGGGGGLSLQHPGGSPAHNRALQLPDRPQWREQLAPGVIQPDEGMVPLPLEPQANGGTFTNLQFAITFQGQLQKPYRPERLLVSTSRLGGVTATAARVLGQIFVGTDLQAAEITAFDLELVGLAQSFGTRLTCKAAEPGVLVRVLAQLSTPLLTTTDTIFVSMMWLGRIVH